MINDPYDIYSDVPNPVMLEADTVGGCDCDIQYIFHSDVIKPLICFLNCSYTTEAESSSFHFHAQYFCTFKLSV